MRRNTLSLMMTIGLLVGCTATVTPPPQTKPLPSPTVRGVPLAELDPTAAPTANMLAIPPTAGNGPAPNQRDVAFSTGTDGYAVTDDGGIEKTADGGASWSLIYRLKGGRFSRVEVVDSQTVFAVAQTNCVPSPDCKGPDVLLRTNDGGTNWTVLQPDLPPLPEQLRASGWDVLHRRNFQFVSAQVGYAAGDIKEHVTMQGAPLIVTRDGGQTWRNVQIPDGFRNTGGFRFVTADRGYVTTTKSGEAQILGTEDGGKTWKTLFSTTEYQLFAVDFLTAKDGYVGGGKSPKTESQPRQVLVATHDGGATWSEVSRLVYNGSPAVELHMINSNEGWASRGGCWSMGGNGPCPGDLHFTRDGGKSWTDTGHRVGRIRSVGQRAWAIDDKGATTLWRTDDGGVKWEQLSRPDAVRVTWVRFVDAQIGFIATNLGLYQTTDGGKNWSLYELGASFDYERMPFFLDRQTALAIIENRLKRSSNGGRAWQPVTIPLPGTSGYMPTASMTSVVPQSAGSAPEAWLAMDGFCPKTETVCPSLLVHSNDGGATWQPLQPGPPTGVGRMAFADSLHGVGLGPGWLHKLLLTADGGKNWTQQAIAETVSLYDASYAGDQNQLWLTGSYNTADPQSVGLLLHSTDGGQNWVAWQAKGVTYHQIQFVTEKDGWAVTAYGSGSGLITTHDAGRTWTHVWPALPKR